jgi:hypothetical protein
VAPDNVLAESKSDMVAPDPVLAESKSDMVAPDPVLAEFKSDIMRVTRFLSRGFAMLALVQALGLVGCPRPTPVPAKALDAGPVDAGPPQDAGPQPIPGAKLIARTDGGSAAIIEEDGGLRDVSALQAGELDLSQPDAAIPDWARLTFTAAVQLQDFRARLVGADGQLVPNHSEIWVADGGTRVEFLPGMEPGSHWPARGCCRLVVDGQVEKLPTGDGSRFQPFEADFTVTPDPDRPVVKRAVKHRHRRRSNR